jgi:nucleoside-diphosphate-sugar epimerase
MTDLAIDLSIAIVTGVPGWLGSNLVQALLKGLPESAAAAHTTTLNPSLLKPQARAVRALCLKAAIQVNSPNLAATSASSEATWQMGRA